MFRRILTIVALATALVPASAGAAAGSSAATPALPPGWSHAEINVTINGSPHTLIYDRGRIIAVGAASITLRERDGSVWTIAISSSTAITIDGQPSSISQLRRFETATAVSIDGGPATRLTVQIPPAVAAAIARQQQRQSQAATLQQTRAARRAARLATGQSGG
jgi:hypothetical protein